jgi:hypothetical protein
MLESAKEDNSKLVITKHRALHSKAGELRAFKSFTFSTKINEVDSSLSATQLTEMQVTETLREI